MIKSILHAAEILECFGENKAELSLTEISRMTKMNKSTVHHILATLVESKFLKKTQNNRYALGLKFFQFGSLVLARMEVGEVAQSVLQHLESIFQETIHLAVLEGFEAAYIHKIESNRSIRMSSRIGQRMPLYCTGVGKVLLAYNEHLMSRVLANGLVARTKYTIVSEQDLYKELARIRERGYAMDEEELEEGLIALAAPIRDYTGQVIAAVSIAGPTERMRARLPRIVAELLIANKQISEEMGYFPREKSDRRKVPREIH